MWDVVGGNPADYFNFDGLWGDAGRGDAGRGDAITAVVERFVSDLLSKAIKALDATITADKHLSPLFAHLASTDAVPLSMPAAMRIARPSPDKVLREATRDEEEAMLVPATQAMAVVLRYGLKKAPSLAALR